MEEHLERQQEVSFSTGREVYPTYVRVHSDSLSPTLQPEPVAGTDSIGLSGYWQILKRRLAFLVLSAFAGLLAGILCTLPQTPLYNARAVVEIQYANDNFLNTSQVNPVAEGFSSFNVSSEVQTQMRILQSDYLVKRVIAKLKAQGKLEIDPPRPGRLSFLRDVLHLPSLNPVDPNYAIHAQAMKDLSVRQLGQTRAIELLFTSSHPQFAADFVNMLAAEYVDLNVEARWKMSEHTGEWLRTQLDGRRVKLQESERALQNYAERSGLLFTAPASGSSDKVNVSEEKLRQVQEELSKAQAYRANAQAQYNVAKSARPETLGDVLKDDGLRDIQAKLTDLRRQEAEAITIYTPKHEKVKRIQAQIAPLQAELDRERGAILQQIKNDYDAAAGREKLLLADYEGQTRVVTDQAGKSVQYNVLKGEVDSNRQLYESMLQQVSNSSVASAIRASNVRIVDPADPPAYAFSPNLRMNCALGLLCGLFIGVTFVLIREQSDRTLQHPGDTRFWTRLPELAVVPSAKFDARFHRPIANLASAKSLGINIGSSRRGKEPVELITSTHKPSAVSEAFRNAVTSVLFVGENGSRPQVLVLTSPGPGDGKTTAVSNLAISMAQIGRRVLVIDADLRRPRMHELFDLPNKCGLSNLLAGRMPAEVVIDTFILKTSVPRLHVLPSGPADSAPGNLLHSPNMADLLTKFRKDFDTILIDTPPMLELPDARIVGRLADGVVLVARVGKTTRDAAMAAHQRLVGDRARVIGTILNDWNPRNSRKGYYGQDRLFNGDKNTVYNRFFDAAKG